MGGISNELGDRALSTVDPGPSLGSEDRCCVSHVSRNDARLAGYATEPSASRARECGSAQGSREKRLHSRRLQKSGKCRVTSISSTNGVHPGSVRNSSSASSRSRASQCAIPRTIVDVNSRRWVPEELPQNQTAPRRDEGDGGRTRRWVPARGRHQVAHIPRAVERLLALRPPGPVGAAGAAGNRRGGGALAGLAAILASRVSPAGVSPVHGSAQAAPRQVRGLRGIRRYQRRGRHRQPGPGVGQDGGGTDRVDAGGARRVPQVHRLSHPGGRLRGERR